MTMVVNAGGRQLIPLRLTVTRWSRSGMSAREPGVTITVRRVVMPYDVRFLR
jgi:hypothetical protein